METKTFGIELTKALATFYKAMPSVKKESENPFFKSSYAGLDSILPAIKKPLEVAGLVFTQIPTGENELITMIIHAETGQYIEGRYSMKPTKDDPQGRGSSLTYSRRYALVAMLGLNCDKDDDGNAASQPSTTKEKTITYDEKPSEKLLRDQQALSISKLASALGYKKTTLKKDIQKDLGLELVEKNFAEIIDRLQVLHSEKMANKNG